MDDDLLDIRKGASQDFDGNGLPDGVEPGRMAVGVRGGGITPRGRLGSSTREGPTVTADVTYLFSQRIHADLRAGFSRLDGKNGARPVKIWSLAANAKLVQPLAGGFRGFLNGGLGTYVVDGSTEAGVNAGLGITRAFSTHLYVETGFDMTWTFTMPSDIRFARIQTGFVWTP